MPKSCATLLSPRGPSLALRAIHLVSRLLEVADLCSSNVSDTANRLLKRTDSEGSSSVAEKKSSAVPLFRSGHMSAICAGLGSKGKVGVQRGRETAGVYPLVRPRGVSAHFVRFSSGDYI